MLTPEEKQQRLADIRIRHRMSTFAFEGQEPPPAMQDIDFLLSLVKEQEADCDVLSRQEVVARIEKQIRLWNNDTVTMACADILAELKQMPATPDAATVLSAYLEKLRELRDRAAGFGSNPFINGAVGAYNAAIEALETLSIEQPKE